MQRVWNWNKWRRTSEAPTTPTLSYHVDSINDTIFQSRIQMDSINDTIFQSRIQMIVPVSLMVFGTIRYAVYLLGNVPMRTCLAAPSQMEKMTRCEKEYSVQMREWYAMGSLYLAMTLLGVCLATREFAVKNRLYGFMLPILPILWTAHVLVSHASLFAHVNFVTWMKVALAIGLCLVDRRQWAWRCLAVFALDDLYNDMYAQIMQQSQSFYHQH